MIKKQAREAVMHTNKQTNTANYRQWAGWLADLAYFFYPDENSMSTNRDENSITGNNWA